MGGGGPLNGFYSTWGMKGAPPFAGKCPYVNVKPEESRIFEGDGAPSLHLGTCLPPMRRSDTGDVGSLAALTVLHPQLQLVNNFCVPPPFVLAACLSKVNSTMLEHLEAGKHLFVIFSDSKFDKAGDTRGQRTLKPQLNAEPW